MGEEKQIIMLANFSDPQKLEPAQATSAYHLVARSEGLVSMTVNLPSNVNSDVDFYFNRHTHKVVTAVNGVATLIVKAETEGDKDREFPSEVLKEPGFTVSIIYENNNNQITTNYVFFPVYTNGIGEEPLEYDDDSYIDAKIAREAAEYALDEIDDLNTSVTDLEITLNSLDDRVTVLEATTASEGRVNSLENTVTSISNRVTTLENNVFFPSLASGSTIEVYYSNDGSQDTCKVDTAGFISSDQTELDFIIPLPKRLRSGQSIEIYDLAFTARIAGGYLGDYYAHQFGYRTFKEEWTSNSPVYGGTATTATTGVISDISREYWFGLSRSDCSTCALGYPGYAHYSYYDANNKIHRFAATTLASPIVDSSGIHYLNGYDLNTPGLIVKLGGIETSLVGWDGNTSGNVSVKRSHYEVTVLDTSMRNAIRVRVRMPFGQYAGTGDPYPSAEIFARDGVDADAPYMNHYLTTTKNSILYKKWVPIWAGKYSTEKASIPWQFTVRNGSYINNEPIAMTIDVLTLRIV